MGMTNMITMLSGPVLQPIVGGALASMHGPVANFEDYPLEVFEAALAVLPIGLFVAAILAFMLKDPSAKSVRTWVRQKLRTHAAPGVPD